jgi:hypothetical protein
MLAARSMRKDGSDFMTVRATNDVVQHLMPRGFARKL